MTIISNNNINPYMLNANLYQLAVRKSNQETNIKMSLLTNYYHTNSLPNTHSILEDALPAVLRTECYNDSNLPFSEEVRNTEIGHLFEHILLEYLCQMKISNGYKKASFRGLTSWNWRKDAKGTYHITIQAKPEDTLFFKEALRRTIKLVNKIIDSNNPIVADLN
jgi:hypothetical protein